MNGRQNLPFYLRRNKMKKIVLLLLTIALSLSSLLALASCGGGSKDCKEHVDADNNGKCDNCDASVEKKFTYTVTFKDQKGEPISGVKMTISDMNIAATSSVFADKETDENGKATLELDAENKDLGIMIKSVPSDCTKPATVSGIYHALFGSKTDIEVVLNREIVEMTKYTVKIVDQNGDAVKDVTFQICHGENCFPCPDATNASGEASMEFASSIASESLMVKILSVPDGYAKPAGDADGYHASFGANESTVTITITKN